MRRVKIKPVLIDAVEKCRKAVVIALRQRIELMVVAPRALKRQSERRVTKSIDTVGDIFRAPLRLDASALGGLAVEPVEGRGQPLVARGICKEIARQLFRQKFVVRKIAVEGIDNPVAIRPGRAERVVLITVTIGVSHGVEPWRGHALAVTRGGQKSVNYFLEGGRGFVREKRVHFGRGGR